MGLIRSAAYALVTFVIALTLVSCSGSMSGPGTTTADFSLSVAPSTIGMNAGGSGQTVSVSATSMNGFTGTVAVALSGLPSGVTASPSTLSLTPGTAQSVAITAAASATPGAATITFTGTSGMLSHTASVAATVIPPPDFSLQVSPAALTIAPAGPGAQISLTAVAANGFASPVAVTISGLPLGVTANPASLTLTPGTAATTTLTAALGTASKTSTVTFTGTSGSLSHSANTALTVGPTNIAATTPDVTTYHYNVARDGLNPAEKILTPANVNATQFGKVGFFTVDGKVDAEPLFLSNLTIGGAQHNVLYVASEHGSLYAFDADSGTRLWKTSVIPSGETTSDDHNCTQITTEIGITSTPVIDRSLGAHGTIFVVGMSKESNGTYHQRLHALDITTGAEVSGSPTTIAATYPGTGDNSQNGNVIFDPAQYAERSALLLLNGNVYLSWTSHCDIGLYTGWLMAYSESTLQQTAVLNLTPNGHMGSIWMSGNGPAADSAGNIYLLDANGTFDTTLTPGGFPTSNDFGNAMLKLANVNGKISVTDYFETYNTVDESSKDLDLGSGGALLFDQTDAAGTVHHLIVGAGKDKNIFLGDRDNLGKFIPMAMSDTNIYQKITGQLVGLNYTTPAYFNNVLYYGADGDTLKAFPFTNAKMATAPSSHSAAMFAHPGTTPAVSANGTQDGIVWAVESNTNNPGVLHAYDPTNLANEYYNSKQAANSRDSFGNGNKFITPLVINGKVYVGTQTGVAVFGLLPQ